MPNEKQKRKRIPARNKSPFGWWMASYIERFEYEDEDKTNLNRRCDAWENTIIIQAKDREQAYRKAEKVGRLGEMSYKTTEGRMGAWRYEGLTSLLPIYEGLEDGAEIYWQEHDNRTVRKIKSWVKAKADLEVFDDEEDSD
jgi:hypothetical protein